MPVTEADLKVDLSLAEIGAQLPLLSLVTPINVPEARTAFIAGEDPVFLYRELPDLDAIANQLDAVDPTSADDPTVSHLAEGLSKELRLRIELLRHMRNDELCRHIERARVRLQLAHDQREQARLAAAVRAHDPDLFAAMDREGNVG